MEKRITVWSRFCWKRWISKKRDNVFLYKKKRVLVNLSVFHVIYFDTLLTIDVFFPFALIIIIDHCFKENLIHWSTNFSVMSKMSWWKTFFSQNTVLVISLSSINPQKVLKMSSSKTVVFRFSVSETPAFGNFQ
jgi:hypothetical protein